MNAPSIYEHTAFHRFTARNLCPHCNHATPCISFDNGDVLCHREGDADRWTEKYITGYWHRASDDGRDPGARPLPQRTPAPSTPPPETADAATRHAVYSRLVALCPLSLADRDYLKTKSGHTDAMIDGNYGTLPPQAAQGALMTALVGEFGADTLRTVPGIVDAGSGHLRWSCAGLLIPVRDRAGRVQACRVRVSLPDGEKSYFWLSRTKDGGPSSGAPAHIARPSEVRDHRIYLCESEKSANYLAHALGAVVVSLAGQSNHRPALAVAEELRDHEAAEVAVLLLDAADPADPCAERKAADTARNRQALAVALARRGFCVKVAHWTYADGKGPDDVLIAGGTWQATVWTECANGDDPDPHGGPKSGPNGDRGPGRGPSGPEAETKRVQQEAIQRERTANRELLTAYTALYRFALTEAYTESEKKALLWTLWEKHHYHFGMPIPATFRDVYIPATEMPQAGLSVNSFRTARQRFVADKVFIETECPAGPDSTTGFSYNKFSISGERLEHLIVGLDPASADADARTAARVARAVARSEEARARSDKAKEKRERREEQDRLHRMTAARANQERRKHEEEAERLAHQATEAKAEAEAMRQVATAAQQEAARIVAEAQQASWGQRDSLPCGSCGTLIDVKNWRCDDCRAEGTDADQFAARDAGQGGPPSFGAYVEQDGKEKEHLSVDVSKAPKLGGPPPSLAPQRAGEESVKVCRGGCGAPTPVSISYCGGCRSRDTRAPLPIANRSGATTQPRMSPATGGAA